MKDEAGNQLFFLVVRNRDMKNVLIPQFGGESLFFVWAKKNVRT